VTVVEDWLDRYLALDRADRIELHNRLDDVHRAELERQIAARTALGWRADPISMAVHLTRDSKEPVGSELGPVQPWRHSMLLSQSFAKAMQGYQRREITPWARQQWKLQQQVGKGLHVDTPIPTVDGWRPIGSLRRGDLVFGGDGRLCEVTFVAARRRIDCYRVELHDGSTLVADGDHLWKVYDRMGHDPEAWKSSRTKGAWRVVDTRTMRDGARERWRIPRCPGLELVENPDLPIDPYVLGVWLGDGTSAAAMLTCADDEILDHVAAAGWPARRVPIGRDRYRCTWSRTGLQTALRHLGVLGNKHVPDAYLWAGDKQRLSLLQGLMDTDGSISRGSGGYTGCEFTSTNHRLADAVRFLARSLGIQAKIAEGRATLDGRDCGPKWRVTFTTDQPVFRLSRKAALLYDIPGPRRGDAFIGVKAITPIESVETVCIQVDSEDRTYLAGENLTVTHNTTAARWSIIWALDMDPSMRWLYLGYASEKVVDEASKMLDIIELYGDQLRFRLRPDRKRQGQWRTDQGGGVYAAGITGGVAGYPGDGVMMDDLIKGAEAAASLATRQRAYKIWQGEIRMRVQGGHCPIVDLGSRAHEDDVTGRLDRAEAKAGPSDPDVERWHRIVLPAFCTDPETDPLHRELGEVLCPERFDEAEVRKRRRTAGSFLWAALGQQNPTPEEGEEIKRAWFKVESRRPDVSDLVAASWDMKLTDRQVGDNAVGQVWGRVWGGFWCLDQLHGIWGTPIVRAAIALLQVRWPAITAHWIENTGKGPDLIPVLRAGDKDYVLSDAVADDLGMLEHERAEVQAMLRRGLSGIVPVNPKGDKKVRARAVAPLIEAGDVHLFEDPNNPWCHELINEAVSLGIPGVHDDMLDTMTQALSKLRAGPAGVHKPQAQSLAAPPVAAVPVNGARTGGVSAGVHRPRRRLG